MDLSLSILFTFGPKYSGVLTSSRFVPSFSGALPSAVSAFKNLYASSSSSNQPIPVNTWLSYQESLIRCGAFDDYIASLQLQLSSDASLAPSSLHVGPVTVSIKLAHKLADYPHLCTLNEVDGEMVEHLRRKVREVIGEEKWVEVERILTLRVQEIEMPEMEKEEVGTVLESILGESGSIFGQSRTDEQG